MAAAKPSGIPQVVCSSANRPLTTVNAAQGALQEEAAHQGGAAPKKRCFLQNPPSRLTAAAVALCEKRQTPRSVFKAKRKQRKEKKQSLTGMLKASTVQFRTTQQRKATAPKSAAKNYSHVKSRVFASMTPSKPTAAAVKSSRKPKEQTLPRTPLARTQRRAAKSARKVIPAKLTLLLIHKPQTFDLEASLARPLGWKLKTGTSSSPCCLLR